MSLVPRTLLWRTFLLVALLMLLSVLAWFEIYSRYEREPRARQLAQLVVSVANLTRVALLTARPAQRVALLQELSDREGIRIYPSEPEETIVALPDGAFVRLVIAEVQRQLGIETRLAWEREGEQGLWVSFRIEDDEYWVKLPPERLERVFPQQWIGWGAAALALSLIGAYLIVFRITRPLKALSQAASRIGSGEPPPPLEDQRGPLEIRTVTRAFNQMSNDLKQLDADRALILAGISHDLRTPLARLRLGVELSGTDAETREGMVTDIDEMDKVIGQFLDFARESAGEAPEICDLKALCGEIAEQYRKRGIALDTRLADLPPLPLRALAIRRSIANLIDNACRYADASAIALHTRREDGMAIVEVLDRGPGIPPQQVERLKRPFTRLDGARSGAAGAGLGLAIVDRVARAHQGEFRLLAREGGGLAAQLRLPLAPTPAAQRARAPNLPVGPTPAN